MTFNAGPSGPMIRDLRINLALSPASLDRDRPCRAQHIRSPFITI